MSAAPPPAPSRRAYGSILAVGVFLVLAGAALAADLVSKHVVFEDLLADANCQRQMMNHLGDRAGANPKSLLVFFHRDVMPGVRWSLSTNPGVVFGLDFARWAVNIGTVLAILTVAVLFAWSDRRAWATHAALALILAGALGNLYDRLFSVVQLPAPGVEPIQRHVRDFIDLSQLHYPYVFNVADAWLVIGVGVLMLQWVFLSRSKPPASSNGKPAK